jgi:hypoxanthine phosphoribosyltransferase
VTDPPVTLISPDELAAGVRRLGGALSETYDDGVVLVSVLKGSLIFVSDLVRTMATAPVVDFLAISPYEPGSGRVRLVKDLDTDLSGRDVVLVEDIVDTGLTLAYLLGELGRREPRSLQVCTLLDRASRRIIPTPLRFVGFEIPDVFVIGYGLDYAGRYRNLDLIAVGDPEQLAADPDVYVEELYRHGSDR